MTKKLKLGISSCLLGEKVRWDGSDKRCDFLLNILMPYASFVTCCPEVAIGLPVPRPTVHLIGKRHAPDLVFVKDESHKLTDEMNTFSTEKVEKLSHLDGYIFKKGSPTCGMERVKVYQEYGKPPKLGVGLFAKTLMDRYPLLPVEEEGRLNDSVLRENFIERVFLYKKLKSLCNKPTAKALVKFHTAHKFSLMSHSTEEYKKIGQMVSHIDKTKINEVCQQYMTAMMKAFTLKANKKKHTNVLQHIYGYLKDLIDELDRVEMREVIEQYRLGKLPLIVPITLLRHHINRTKQEYINDQVYLFPYPDELMLRNSL